MGGTVIKESNDDMVDDLISSLYLKAGKVEKVLRTVDRAFYYLPEFRRLAYRDEAWKRGNLHLSAPRIYSRVLEHLDLQPGLSFLNIGSGTGYLSTMAGLLLGPYGVNHGIEIQPDVVDYAYEKLEQFKTTCSGVDVFEFCEPYFIVGNVFDLSHDRKYDRIYCGAACPEVYHEHIKKYMKIGGILIMPCGDDLLKIVRNSETSWKEQSLIPVSFSTLKMVGKNSSNMISMPDPNPLSLQELCRSTIRIVLRGVDLVQKRKRKRYPNCLITDYIVMASHWAEGDNEINDYDNDSENVVEDDTDSSDTDYRVTSNDTQNHLQQSSEESASSPDRNVTNTSLISASCVNTTNTTVTSNDSTSDCNENCSSSNVSNSSPRISCTSRDRNDSSSSSDNYSPYESMSEVKSKIVEATLSSKVTDELEIFTKGEERSFYNFANDFLSTSNTIEKAQESRYNESNYNDMKDEISEPSLEIESGCDSLRSNGKSTFSFNNEHNLQRSYEPNQNIRKQADDGNDDENDHPEKLLKREKLNSGISEESDDDEGSDDCEVSSFESKLIESWDFDESGSHRIVFEESVPDSYPANDVGFAPVTDTLPFKYRKVMEAKIQALPLPQSIKLYLNHNRPFEFS